jgi:hypothetical protein
VRGDAAIEAEPDEALDELVDGEEAGHGGEEELAALFDLVEGGDANGPEDCAADEVGAG